MESLNIFLREHLLFTAVAVLMGSYIIASSIFPVIIYLSHTKNLAKKPNSRSSHSNAVPTLGGLAIFIGLNIIIALITIIMGDKTEVSEILSVVTATSILLFVGIKDDLMEISSRKKFITQLVAALLVILLTGHRITDFHGLLGLHTIPRELSILFTVFVYILVINAYNLIDGIDGLAAGVGIVIFGFCGGYFIANNLFIDSFLSLATIGALAAFTKYNISESRKVFMGDTGSMIIGFILTYQIVALLGADIDLTNDYPISNIPVVALALLSYPLFDTLRVFVIRIKNKKSPFTADRNHIHHKLIDLGFTHLKASLIVILYTNFIVGVSIATRHLDINIHLMAVVLIGSFLMTIPQYINSKNSNN